jgi:hypothetical protein
MDLDSKKILKTLNPRKVWVPVALGIGIVVFLFLNDPEMSIEKLALVFDATFFLFYWHWLSLLPGLPDTFLESEALPTIS